MLRILLSLVETSSIALTGGKAGGACAVVGDEEVMSSLKGGMSGVMVSRVVYIAFLICRVLPTSGSIQ